ncbi:hypothetical protein D3C80_1743400 [compost metagenome]
MATLRKNVGLREQIYHLYSSPTACQRLAEANAAPKPIKVTPAVLLTMRPPRGEVSQAFARRANNA